MGFGNKQRLPWWRSKFILWLFLMLPGLMLLLGLVNRRMDYDRLMHVTGELSARFLVFSLVATPLIMLFPKRKFPRWLVRNKRYFGVAAFVYGLFHTTIYLIEVPISQVKKEFFEFSLIIAWISLAIWVPMAITSTDGWVKRLKATWKKIHNWGYLAALLAFTHWAFIHYQWKPALIHAVPVIVLQGYRWINIIINKEKEI
ncbi:ferric reductase-like transmembrane domain-containing protein [Flavobacterium sp. NRK F10]|uniref:ferric reductase-like transmembrane domain-containing protein n=1 Tax=Flavobacterium sp. NRK F10 TaxID=2954931 RepID=UPI00209073B1|nr:ferric reductase-like transmembrane domain-containing protein [Flavobacterium sp. NRK F10]MCO6175925.1 ferric reductase-like transmembrane domain-containing protein [Flavobacterium sp. NRK F10]